MTKNFYGGKSGIFHLKDSKDNIIPLTIKSKNDLNNQYTHYELTIESPLKIGEEYTLFDEHCQSVPALYSHIVKTGKFSEDYYYDKDDLGISYTPEKTTFKVWSPIAREISVVLQTRKGKDTWPMKKDPKGVWSVSIPGDLLEMRYTYLVRVNSQYNEIADPYTPFLGINGEYSTVDDLSLLPLAEKVPVDVMESETDAIIYEASIRDMTSQSGTGILHPKRFAGFTEESEITKNRRTGFSYLKELNISHVQLMPVFDFGSTDERYPNIFYNWGYDPMHYRALEGSYSSDPANPRSRIVEFSKMVQDLHTAGIKVNLDLVFNHVYSKSHFCLENLVPNYYFLMNANGDFSNGSFCGNDIDTRPAMSRKYFLDTVKMIIDLYDVDGFRFDLMGILDIDLMNEIARITKEKKPDFMIYGEGWNMPSFVPEDIRASQQNQQKMPQVGHFSDRFREVIRGSNGELERKGYASGDISKMGEARQVMMASVLEGRFDTPKKAVNYVECHDNHTLWDKNRFACENEDGQQRSSRQILTNAMVLLAQGIPFLHSGQEFGRTKQNLGNTYNRSDNYNRIDYFRRNRHEDIVEATKKLIEIRRNHPAFRLQSRDEIENNVKIETIDNQVMVYKVEKGDDRLIVFFNPTQNYYDYNLNSNARILFDSGHCNGEQSDKVYIAPISVVVCQYI